ncbi:MAG: hypothetical protein B7Z26_07240 [Asticcacaulis sp. 32-58-5]|nr:MAG: hypothetical protein B7Z26_07240 [Asticcacaulis sp. 32-58-5]
MEEVDLNLRLNVPEYFFDEPYGAKGYFSGCQLEYEGQTYNLSFYDPVRLAQTIKDDIESDGIFFEKNVIVVQSITVEHLEKAIQTLINANQVYNLSPN